MHACAAARTHRVVKCIKPPSSLNHGSLKQMVEDENAQENATQDTKWAKNPAWHHRILLES